MVSAATDLINNLRGLNVNVVLNREVDKHLIKEMNPDAKILVTTGASHDSLIMKAMESGAKSYLTKPFGMNDLITEIDKMKCMGFGLE